MATGVIDGLFMEVHNDPDSALCDGSCMLELAKLDVLLQQFIADEETKFGLGHLVIILIWVML